MPFYEYRCKKCRRRTMVLVRGLDATNEPRCRHCGYSEMERLISSFIHHRSWGDTLNWSPDEDAINEASEDPRHLASYMHRIKQEMGEVSPEFDEMVGNLEHEAVHEESGDMDDDGL